ncbi:hypothetical protein RSOLAG1IB_09412 [Rhizoctonia solani AG-1 IB]|uniref:Uncharacterized protein n=1 Tax=Thanatephorus cucumeris (strain AG1-IB / isolate 7/3/14) TaxID=1108050 RepID=A0A0B7FVA3_THACB|nr:hypothetical protein RSOLAG1IB_09412 [Rhizoctonia solani AG-1 IB]
MTKNSGGSGSGPESGNGSGSSSGGSGGTARPKPTHDSSESITFTFSSRNSPFAQLSPPGSVKFVSSKRRGSESSRDRPNRKQQSSQPSGWIALSPLKPVTELSPPLFDTPSSHNTSLTRATKTTAVFSSRAPNNTRISPRLSLMAQHHHATSPHPSFNTPPQLVTPPPQDPFGQLRRSVDDSYFPLMPSPSQHSSGLRSKPKKASSSKLSTQTSRPNVEQARPVHSSSHNTSSSIPSGPRKPSTSESTPRVLSRTGHQSVGNSSALVSVTKSSSSSTPTQRKAQEPVSPHSKISPQPPQPSQLKPSSPPAQPSIDAFRDCFGVLTERIENVFPTRPRQRTSRSNSGGSENISTIGSGPSMNDFQRRWTRRWIRRALRGVGSMSSGSTSSGSASAGACRIRGGRNKTGSPSMVNTMIYLGLGSGSGSGSDAREAGRSVGSGSQDSLDRVRISRSNAPSPSNSGAGNNTVASMDRVLNEGNPDVIEEVQPPNAMTMQPTAAA